MALNGFINGFYCLGPVTFPEGIKVMPKIAFYLAQHWKPILPSMKGNSCTLPLDNSYQANM